LQIKKLPVPNFWQKTFYDAALPGISVRVSQGGSNSFIVLDGEKRRKSSNSQFAGVVENITFAPKLGGWKSARYYLLIGITRERRFSMTRPTLYRNTHILEILGFLIVYVESQKISLTGGFRKMLVFRPKTVRECLGGFYQPVAIQIAKALHLRKK